MSTCFQANRIFFRQMNLKVILEECHLFSEGIVSNLLTASQAILLTYKVYIMALEHFFVDKKEGEKIHSASNTWSYWEFSVNTRSLRRAYVIRGQKCFKHVIWMYNV